MNIPWIKIDNGVPPKEHRCKQVLVYVREKAHHHSGYTYYATLGMYNVGGYMEWHEDYYPDDIDEQPHPPSGWVAYSSDPESNMLYSNRHVTHYALFDKPEIAE